jgi:hypothetical protein
LLDAAICQASATCHVDISDSVAGLDQLHNRSIGDVGTVAEMNIMQILPQLADSVDGPVRYKLALGKNKVP